ncbi:MAG: hypothetical protein JNL19_09845 [Burkholderiales bacterium]|nr:hypothetical protein [Burkholderiales bacterium]
MKSILFAFASILILTASGCATYTPSMAKIDPVAAGSAKGQNKGVTVHINEHIRKAKSERAFDTDLRDDGVAALLVGIQNGHGKPFSFTENDIVLMDGDKPLTRLSPEQAAEKAKKSAAGRAIGWSLIVPIISIPIAATASVMHTNKVNRQMREDFVNKNLGNMVLAPGKDVSGFAFFEVEKTRSSFPNLTLVLTGALEGEAEKVKISVALAPIDTAVPDAAPVTTATPEPTAQPK